MPSACSTSASRIRREVALAVVEHDDQRVDAIRAHLQLDVGGGERLVVVGDRPGTRALLDAGFRGLDVECPWMDAPGDLEVDRGTRLGSDRVDEHQQRDRRRRQTRQPMDHHRTHREEPYPPSPGAFGLVTSVLRFPPPPARRPIDVLWRIGVPHVNERSRAIALGLTSRSLQLIIAATWSTGADVPHMWVPRGQRRRWLRPLRALQLEQRTPGRAGSGSPPRTSGSGWSAASSPGLTGCGSRCQPGQLQPWRATQASTVQSPMMDGWSTSIRGRRRDHAHEMGKKPLALTPYRHEAETRSAPRRQGRHGPRPRRTGDERR